MKKTYLLIIISIIFSYCTKKEDRTIEPSFYFWKQNFKINDSEKQILDSLKVKKLYVKFFDVIWKEEVNDAVPVAVLNIDSLSASVLEIIPTVFITNKTMLKIDRDKIKTLAKRILKKITEINNQFKNNTISEIQFDCDWSEQSKDKYFYLLNQIKNKIADQNIKISSTIRLHQVKYYKKTGVPPVDKGMIMFYNMGKINDINEKNSILNLKTAEEYLYNFEEYPLELDVALPVFSWAVIFRKGKAVKLINNIDKDLLNDHSKFKKSEDNYTALKSFYLHSIYVYKGDKIRLEEIKMTDLRKAAKMLSSRIKNRRITVSFFHLDETVAEDYDFQSLQGVIDSFSLPYT